MIYLGYRSTGEDSLNEAIDSDGQTLLTGQFNEISEGHWGRGTVQIAEKSDGDLELQFIDVEIAQGPDLYVYLSDAGNFVDEYDDLGNIIDLGKLKSQSGTFIYIIPSRKDFSSINSVLIYCYAARVIFTYTDFQAA